MKLTVVGLNVAISSSCMPWMSKGRLQRRLRRRASCSVVCRPSIVPLSVWKPVAERTPGHDGRGNSATLSR
jgi:hypothetical protein